MKKREARRPLLLPGPGGEARKPYDIRERTLELAVRMLQVAAALPATAEGYVVRQQLARAGTSIGANVEEADGAVSPADKRRSLIIARKETRELRYWLRILERRWPAAVDVKGDLQEVTEILRILSAIVVKLGGV